MSNIPPETRTVKKHRGSNTLAAIGGYIILFIFYQLPQGVYDYVVANRIVWIFLTLLFFLIAHLLAKKANGRGISEFGFQRHPGWLKNFGIGLLLGIGFSALSEVGGFYLHLYTIDQIAPLGSLVVPALLLAFGSFLASASEDVLTRGYVFRHQGRFSSLISFVLLSSVLYVLNHIYVLQRGVALWSFLFALGTCLAYPLWVTKSLWFTIGVHWGWNIVYHISGAALKTTELSKGQASTWVSAGTAFLLLLAIVAVSGLLSKTEVGYESAR
jgi:membrane protease YdiL (CAAX protease family)